MMEKEIIRRMDKEIRKIIKEVYKEELNQARLEERVKLKEELRIMYQCFTRYHTTCKRDCKWDICPLKLEKEDE